jgi:hypothetical protein
VKAASFKGIVFPALVDDATVPMGRRLVIGDYTIQFPYLKRRWVALIIEA